MARDMKKIIAETEEKVDNRYELMVEELKELWRGFVESGDYYTLIRSSFVYGYAMGQRAEKARRKKANDQ